MRRLSVGVVGMFVGSIIATYLTGHKYCTQLVATREIADKHLAMVRIYDIWMAVKQKGCPLDEYLLQKGIQKVAIYGMSYMGIRLFHELEDSLVNVKYGIDCNPRARVPGVDIYHLNEIEGKCVDAVIVTAIFSFDNIKRDLEKFGFYNIISLDEILYDLI